MDPPAAASPDPTPQDQAPSPSPSASPAKRSAWKHPSPNGPAVMDASHWPALADAAKGIKLPDSSPAPVAAPPSAVPNSSTSQKHNAHPGRHKSSRRGGGATGGGGEHSPRDHPDRTAAAGWDHAGGSGGRGAHRNHSNNGGGGRRGNGASASATGPSHHGAGAAGGGGGGGFSARRRGAYDSPFYRGPPPPMGMGHYMRGAPPPPPPPPMTVAPPFMGPPPPPVSPMRPFAGPMVFHGTMVFLLGNFLSSIPFLFLVSILSSLVFYFLIGLRNEFSFLMYFVITIFVCLLANEALMMIIAYIWLETYKCTLTLIFLYVIMMLVAGYFRIRENLPYPVWTYPLSFISFHTYAVQGLVENEYVGTSFAVGQIRTIPGVQAVRGSYDISSSANAKWVNLLVLLLMAIGYRIVLYLLLRLDVRKHARMLGNWRSWWPSVHSATGAK